MTIRIATIENVREAEANLRPFVSPPPLIRSYALEKELGFPAGRRVWLKDFGWTPSGSFKLYGGLNWMANNQDRIGTKPVAAHSSGNFASGIAFAGMSFKKKVIVVMPETAPRIKFERTRSFGAEIRTYDITRDHITGDRERMARDIVQNEGGVLASPFDDPFVIAGNGVGALEIVRELQREGRTISHFICPISGGGLLAGQAIAIADGFPKAQIVAAEPALANDFTLSLAQGKKVRLEKPTSICDGLLSYEVGQHNWPILQRLVTQSIAVPDLETRAAMRWLYEKHGLRSEPSGTIGVAALLGRSFDISGEGDIVITLSGRNVDEAAFADWIKLP
jgi:threonine dehydratase